MLFSLRSPSTPLLIAQGFSQALVLVSLPFISRMFPAEAVGMWTLLQTSAVFIWAFSTLRAEVSMVQATGTKEMGQIFGAGLTAHSIFLPILILLFAVIYPSWFSGVNWMGGIIYLWGFGWNQLAQSYLLRSGQWIKLSWFRIGMAVLGGPLLVLMAPVAGEVSLWFSLCLSVMVPPLFFHGGNLKKWWSFSISELGWYLARFRKNVVFGVLQNALNMGADQLLILLVGLWISPVHAAAFFIVQRFCTAPISLVAGSVGQYNFRIFEDAYRSGTFGVKYPLAHWRKWFPLGVLYYGILALIGPKLFPLILGTEGGLAGVITPWLALPSFFIFLASPTSSGFTVVQKQEYAFYLSFGPFLRLAGAGLAVVLSGEIMTGVIVYSVLNLLYTFIYNGLMLRAIHRSCTS